MFNIADNPSLGKKNFLSFTTIELQLHMFVECYVFVYSKYNIKQTTLKLFFSLIKKRLSLSLFAKTTLYRILLLLSLLTFELDRDSEKKNLFEILKASISDLEMDRERER